jgi:hypothetical protein
MLLAMVFDEMWDDLSGSAGIEFCLPGSDVLIHARAQVTRQERRDRYLLTGVRFERIADEDRERIEAFANGIRDRIAPPEYLFGTIWR